MPRHLGLFLGKSLLEQANLHPGRHPGKTIGQGVQGVRQALVTFLTHGAMFSLLFGYFFYLDR